jgi:hypothetical protein
MTTEEHQKRHFELHRALDELLADFIQHTNLRPSQTTAMQLLEWSAKQCIKPTDIPNANDD